MSAAFDTQDLDLLINRVSIISITSSDLSWFKSYIFGRSFVVDHSSKRIPLKHGIPQASVLGPIIINIYLLPMYKMFHKYPMIKFHYFTDDIQMYSSICSSYVLNFCLLS